MHRSRTTVIGLATTLLVGILLSVAGPANAATASSATRRIADIAGQTFATATDANQRVTMRLPSSTPRYQRWVFTPISIGDRITNVATNGCLATPRTWTGENPPVLQRPCQGSPYEHWQVIRAGDTTYNLRNVGLQGRCAAINRNYSPPRLFAYPCNYGAHNQQFRLMAV